jgi:Astacin (Peptidase family M12A)
VILDLTLEAAFLWFSLLAQAEIDFLLYEFGLIEQKTCIRFVPRTFQIDFVEIINGSGCWSWLGRLGGRQELSMSRNGCFWQGTGAHEAIHALGYDHMHNSIDRDDYVRVLWENIDPPLAFNFEKVDPNHFNNFNTPYDLRSVMHYPRWAFSNNGQNTIEPHDRAYLNIIGEGQFNDGDALRLNRMYQCRT